jgi:hypothetical protein
MGHSAPAPVTRRPHREDRKETHAAASSHAKAALASTAPTVGGGSFERKRGQGQQLKGGGGVGSAPLADGMLSAPARVSAAHTVEARLGDSSNAEASA